MRLITVISLALAEACEKSLSTYRYKKGEGKGDDEHASAMAQSIRKTKLGKKYVVQDGDVINFRFNV